MNDVARQEQIKSGLMAQQRVINSLLGDKEKANKFLATAVKVANDYKLRECHPQSIIDACVNVAQLKLDLSPMLSHAYLVPFKSKKEDKTARVQLIISARGYIAMLERIGWKIKSFMVSGGDVFHYVIKGFEETVTYEKDLDANEEEFRYAVAMAKAPDGTLYVKVMNKKQIEKHRRASQNQGEKESGVWADWFEQMAEKTVIKKLARKLPLGEESIAKALFIDDKPIEAEIENTKPKTQPNINEVTGEVHEEIKI